MIYNFKENTKLFLVFNGVQFRLDIYPDVTATQTFTETGIKQKTIHNPEKMFDAAIIKKASPANFTFTIPLYTEEDFRVVTSLLISYGSNFNLNTFDLYLKSDSETYHIEKCVMENGVFSLVKDQIITINISGTASKLIKFTGVIPGTPFVRLSNYTPIAIKVATITVNGSILSNINSLGLEIKNTISWLDIGNVHKTLLNNNTSYPTEFTLNNRTLSGTIVQYVTDLNSKTVNTYNANSPIRIQINSILDVNIPSATFTNRLTVSDLYTQSFDFRMTYSPLDLSSVVKIT